jgi:hypothetical protein
VTVISAVRAVVETIASRVCTYRRARNNAVMGATTDDASNASSSREAERQSESLEGLGTAVG